MFHESFSADRVNLSNLLSGAIKPDKDVLRHMYYDRCHYPQGRIYQALAIGTSESRKEALKAMTIPALVIHGE